MRIVSIQSSIVDIGQGFLWSGIKEMNVVGVHVCIETDTGVRGDGLCWPGDLPPSTVKDGIDCAVSPLLIDTDPWRADTTLGPAWRAFRVGLPIASIGVVDCALWDLKGHASERSVAELLGLKRTQLKGCASAPPVDNTADAERMLREIEASGFKAIKLHACGNVDVDRDICKVAREIASDDVELLMDAMGIYPRQESWALGRTLDQLNFAGTKIRCPTKT